ncbi:zinc ribbon domain-containing protein, partial [Parvibaculum sp.]
NRHLSRAISDMGFYEFRRQLSYKLERLGGALMVADRFYASSKICSACNTKAETLPLSVRSWTCANCGAQHDRDVNAAINLKNLAGSEDFAVRPVTACGAEGSGDGNDPVTKPAASKQELGSDQKRSSP